MVPEFRERALKVPIHLALSYDEELGCLSAPELIARIVQTLPKPAIAIIGEPSEMRVANAHRGITTFVTTVTGRPGHASAPDAGVNAIACAAECIAYLGRIAGEFAGDRKPGDGPVPEHTTLNVGRIEGGSAVNIIAAHCRFVWECRPAPGVEAMKPSARTTSEFEYRAGRAGRCRVRCGARPHGARGRGSSGRSG